MRTRLLRAATCTVAIVILTACQSSTAVRNQTAPSATLASPPPTPVPILSASPDLVGQPSPVPSPTQSGVAVHLVVNGPLPITITTANPQTCGRSGGAYAVLLQFDLSGQPYQLDASIFDYHGPGTYAIPPERVSLHTVRGASPPHLLAGTSGQISVGTDERSGSVDAALEGDTGETHVSGSFRCR